MIKKNHTEKIRIFQFLTNWLNRKDSQRGYIIVLVLIITTILISVTGQFIIAARTHVSYMRKFDSSLKARYLALTGIHLGKFILDLDKQGTSFAVITGYNTKKNVDSHKDFWAFDIPEIPEEDGSIKLSITDENSKINTSVLANEFVEKTAYHGILQRLFLNMGLSMDYADAIIDWVDIDDAPSPYGAETGDYYSTLTPSYLAKNGEMDSIQELLLVKGVTPEIYYGLGGGSSGIEKNLVEHNKGVFAIKDSVLKEIGTEPKDESTKDQRLLEVGKERDRSLSKYLRVWGYRKDWTHNYNKININTASYRVISALTENMTDDMVTEIIRKRLESPYTSVDDVSDFITDETIRKNVLSVQSYIFSIQSQAEVNGVKVIIHAVYNRDKKKFYYWSEN